MLTALTVLVVYLVVWAVVARLGASLLSRALDASDGVERGLMGAVAVMLGGIWPVTLPLAVLVWFAIPRKAS